MANIIDASEDLIRAAGQWLPSPEAGAAALALALGRVAAAAGLPLEDLLQVARTSHAAGDVLPALAPVLLFRRAP
jgi:hypothetical protein